MHQFIDPIDSLEYDFAYDILHIYFKNRSFRRLDPQHRLSNLAACENPFNVMTFDHMGIVWALHQTNQMELEVELLKHRHIPGFFCETTSYRQEPEPEPGRHNHIFPMVEFEAPGTMDTLRNIMMDLLEYAGFGSKNNFPRLRYEEIAQSYGVKELTSEHETRLANDFGPVVFLEYFPEHTSPFWNMKREGDVAKKIDVILHGIETIGSAERSTDPEEMRERFHSISGGAYVRQLFAKFTKERVEKELEEFLSLDFFPRCGGGIGMNRWIRALKLGGLMPKFL